MLAIKCLDWFEMWLTFRSLERNEIIPVVGSLQKPHDFGDIAAQCDVIVHTAIDRQADTETVDRNTVRFLLDVSREAAQPQTMIYTSCVWILGHYKGQPLTEHAVLSPPQEIAWRCQVENTVINAEMVKGLVIRPGVVYGKQGGLTGMWFHSASNGGAVQIVGDGQNRVAMVHVDDLAVGYLLAAQSGLSGESFNLVDSTHSTVVELVGAAAKAANSIRQLEFIPTDAAVPEMGELGEALALDQVVDASKAHRLLDWQPQHRGFIPEVETYYRAWRSSQSYNRKQFVEEQRKR